MTKCVFCPEPVEGGDYYEYVTGFTRRRSGGGANQITLPVYVEGCLAHPACVRLEVARRAGTAAPENQGSLL